MNTETIQQIQAAVQEVDTALHGFVLKDHAGETYGGENEYTPKSLKEDIKAMLTDLRALSNAHKKFIRLYTRQERVEMAQHLQNIRGRLDEKNPADTVQWLDYLKIMLRPAHALLAKERTEVLTERADVLLEKCAALEELLPKISRGGADADDILGKAPEAQTAHAEIQNILERVEQTRDRVEQEAASVKSDEAAIREFFKAIESRRQQLDQQQVATENYEGKLKEFTEQQDAMIAEADNMLKQAGEALGHTTVYSMSTAFSQRYDADKEEKASGWLVGAGVSAFIGVGISLLWLFDLFGADAAAATGLGAIISRIGGVSIAFYAAWFCASQYTKHRNTMEDYGYKAVLAKSMAAFLNQLGDDDERKSYLALVLSEIHKDPLRKRHDEHDSAVQRFLAPFKSRRSKDGEAKGQGGE